MQKIKRNSPQPQAEKRVPLQNTVPATGLEPVRGCPRGILSPLRLPIPPCRQTKPFTAANTTYANEQWMEVDANHRSNLQPVSYTHLRKIRNTYYFIYSSQWQHELCYATSSSPNSNFTFGGVIISNGDIGFQGRSAKERVAMTGNNHGSMELINGEWYIFYHRQTHKTSFSRQGCAEKISILQDGSIPQVEMTSCGLNNGPLAVSGRYNATIACNLTNGNMPHVEQTPLEDTVPYITHQADEHFITDITNGTIIGYKYFKFTGPTVLNLCIRGDAVGYFELFTDEEMLGSVSVRTEKEWEMSSVSISAVGVHALFLKYHGEGMVQLKEIVFS